MKKLLTLLLPLLFIFSCGEAVVEPSILEKCTSTNIITLKNLSVQNEAIDNLKIYIPEDSYHMNGNILTKDEFTKIVLDNLDQDTSITRVEQMCTLIHPKKTNKQECIRIAQMTADLFEDKTSKLSTLEFWINSSECNSKVGYVEQEESLIKNCLNKSEESLLDLFLPLVQNQMNEVLEDTDFTLGSIREMLLEQGLVLDEDTKSFLNPSYIYYSEIFNREAQMICNSQGIY